MPIIEKQVGASTDDVYRRLTSPAFSRTAAYLPVGSSAISVYQWGSGMRFTDITIPQGAIINQAYLTLRADASDDGTVVNSRISAEDVNNAPTFADDADAFDARFANHTTARVNWDSIPAWIQTENYNSPEIKAVIQEIVDREGWNSGQSIVIFWEDFDDRSTHGLDRIRMASSYDRGSAFAPKLVIDYTPAYVTHEWEGSDSMVLTDALVKNPIKVLADSIILTDVLIKNPIKVFTDAIAFTDVLEKVYIHVRTFADGIALTDTLVKSMSKVLTDGIAFTDTLVKLWVRRAIRILNAVRNLPSEREDEVER